MGRLYLIKCIGYFWIVLTVRLPFTKSISTTSGFCSCEFIICIIQKALRIKKGYTSYEYFAYEHNISRAQFGRYERGEDLRFSTLARIITAFDMTFEEFFSEGFSLESNTN
ncbi:helix-turn-helix domain-containing protein [Elizabethkingia anophelis]|uniref:helix-turn-helix domain-containing protein n=1 Tax=Elizabethkingia anophelis TaxID=1117645 RepID=UPI003891FF94